MRQQQTEQASNGYESDGYPAGTHTNACNAAAECCVCCKLVTLGKARASKDRVAAHFRVLGQRTLLNGDPNLTAQMANTKQKLADVPSGTGCCGRCFAQRVYFFDRMMFQEAAVVRAKAS